MAEGDREGRAIGGGGMIFDTFGLKDMFAFEGVINLRVRSVGPGLVAIVGPNGIGKTGLIEIVPGCNYGKLPGRENDPPVDYATSRAAYLEYSFETDAGDCYRVLVSLDGETRATEGVLEQLLPDGDRVALNDGKISTLRKAILELGFPTFELFINAPFAAQGRGDEFVKSKPSAKKDLFAQFLNLSKLLAQAKAAGANAAACEVVRDRMRAVRDALRTSCGPDLDEPLSQRVAGLQQELATASARRAGLVTTINQLEARLATMQDAVAAHGAATLRIQTLSADLQSREAERSTLLAERPGIGATLANEIAAADRVRDTALATIAQQLQALETNAALVATLKDLDEKLAGNATIQSMAAEIRAAAAAVTKADADIAHYRIQLEEQQGMEASAAIDLRAAEADLAKLVPFEHAHEQATRDSALLGQVPCHGEGAFAACALLTNAKKAVAELSELVAKLAPKAELAERVGRLLREKADYAAQVGLFRDQIKLAEKTKADHALQAGRLAALEGSVDRVKELEQLKSGAIAEAARIKEERVAALAARRADVHAVHASTVAAAQQRHDTAVAAGDRRLADVDARISVIQTETAKAEQDLAAVAQGNVEASTLQQALDAARADVEAVLQTQTRATSGLEEVGRQQEALVQRRSELADLEQRLAAVDQQLVEWRGLEQDLGKGGLADLEIDAAGPQITAWANALLTASYGARFSMQIITQSEKADGSGMKDDFDVQVMDNEKDRTWRAIRTFSGGQRTIIQEALMCAIALYVNERSPMPMRTLWRDETGLALDPDNAVRYVEMLREVRRIGNLHQIFFITHNRECAEMADAQIQVSGTGAALVLPPYAAAGESQGAAA